MVRYHHKDLGIVDPGRYINLLEETKLSHYLDLYVFEKYVRHCTAGTLRICYDLVSVNFAGATLRQESIADKMLHLVEKYMCAANILKLKCQSPEVR